MFSSTLIPPACWSHVVSDISSFGHTAGTCSLERKEYSGLSVNQLLTLTAIVTTLVFDTGELQSVLCVCFASSEVTYAGTFSGDVYKWNENRLQTVIGAHSVRCHSLYKSMSVFYVFPAVCHLLHAS